MVLLSQGALDESRGERAGRGKRGTGPSFTFATVKTECPVKCGVVSATPGAYAPFHSQTAHWTLRSWNFSSSSDIGLIGPYPRTRRPNWTPMLAAPVRFCGRPQSSFWQTRTPRIFRPIFSSSCFHGPHAYQQRTRW